MELHPAGPGSLAAFALVLVFVVSAAIGAVWASTRDAARTGAFAGGLGLWLAVLSGVVAAGWLDEPIPGVFVFLFASNAMALAVALSPVGRRVAEGVPLWSLVAFQGFRLPLELVLHTWGEGGTIPMTMTWEGSNRDVISGVVALLAAPFAGRSRAVAWVANVVGLVLLVNVARVAILSSPLPFAWGVEPPLTLAAHLPYALIVPVCVAGALAGHVVLTRALLGK